MQLSMSVRIVEAACKTRLQVVFETVDQILANLETIGQPNFGLIYDPAQARAASHECLYPESSAGSQWAGLVADLFSRRPSFSSSAYLENGRLGYGHCVCRLVRLWLGGHFTIHQADGIETAEDARVYARRCAEFVRAS